MIGDMRPSYDVIHADNWLATNDVRVSFVLVDLYKNAHDSNFQTDQSIAVAIGIS